MAFSRTLWCVLVLCSVYASPAQQNPPEFDFRKLSSWPGYARGAEHDIQVVGGRAYLAMGDGGLCIADVQDPGNPTVIGRVDLPGFSDEVEVLNNLAFLACGTGGVHVINIANPAAPVRVATVTSASKVLAISTLQPNYLFIAAGQDGVSAYDVSNPAIPSRVATVTRGTPPTGALDVQSVNWGLNINGVDYIRTLLFVAYGSAGGFVFDASDPANMVQIAALPGYMATVSKDDRHVYFVDTSARQIRYLAEDSMASPSFPSFGKGALPDDVRFSDPRLRVYDGNGYVVSKGSSVPLSATYVVGAQSDFPFSFRITNLTIRAAAATRNYDYLGHLFRGLEIYSNASAPVAPVGRLVASGTAAHLRMSGNKVFVSDQQQGIHAFIFETNKTLKHVATYDLGFTLSFDVSGNYLYRAGYPNLQDSIGQVFDISDPAQPRLVADLGQLIPPTATARVLRAITVKDGRAYVSAVSSDAFSSRIYTFDVSNPESPVFLAASNGAAEQMEIVGQTLFATSGGLVSYSIAADGKLTLLQHQDVSGSPSNLRVVGTTAYLCAETQGLKIYDVTDPANMQLLSTYDSPISVVNVNIVGANAFVADARGGFFVLDVSNPASPKLLARQETDNPVNDLKVVDGFVIAANGAEGVTLWKYGPGAPQTIDFPPIADATTRTEPFLLPTPVASSGLPVKLSIASGPATLVNGIVTITGPGFVTVRAFQAGNEIFSSATVDRSFNVIEVPRTPQTILFDPIADASVEDDPFDISVSASSGLPVDVTISGPATLDGPTVAITGQGEVTITATQGGDRDFAPVTLERKFIVRDLISAVAALVRSRNPSAPDADTLLDADPDRDGLPNVVEFLMRTDPTSATSKEGHTTASVIDSGGARYLKAHFLKPRTSRYPMGVQIADFSTYPNLSWISVPAGFSSDGTGSFLLPVANYEFPLIRFVMRYP